jgi:hypothetical protein
MSKAIWIKENLKEGEVYAGLLLGAGGAPDQHIILLPGEAEKVNWQAAVNWAKKAGGDLPTRREQRVLFANVQTEFKQAWYWSGEQHADDSDCAWVQYFGNGNQGNSHKSYEGRARAVRRLIIL